MSALNQVDVTRLELPDPRGIANTLLIHTRTVFTLFSWRRERLHSQMRSACWQSNEENREKQVARTNQWVTVTEPARRQLVAGTKEAGVAAKWRAAFRSAGAFAVLALSAQPA